jgi:hypothetical protein
VLGLGAGALDHLPEIDGDARLRHLVHLRPDLLARRDPE